MFRIRRMQDITKPANLEALQQVQQILREQFLDLAQRDIDKIPELLTNPFLHGFKSALYLAENSRQQLLGFALMSHEPSMHFCFLDYISTARQTTGGGIGGALYQHLRDEARELGACGIFFECLPDDPALCSNPQILEQNRARLKFYEQYGATPIIGTAYETPVEPGGDSPPYLVFDPMGQKPLPSRENSQKMVREILEWRYGHLCPKDYIDMVVASFQDDPLRLRPLVYGKPKKKLLVPTPNGSQKIAIVVNDRHQIHHVRERGYVESPVRISSILKALDQTGLFETLPPRSYPEEVLATVHDRDYLAYFKKVCQGLPEGKSVYPYVFPLRNVARPPQELAVRAGYYCIDTFTPLNRNAWLAARGAVDCALTAANLVLEGRQAAYALVRPPGHHAERRSFGGFCYFNNAAIAAQMLSAYGRVAMLDLDYHHGNGQQTIFYDRADILTISLHGHPRFAYPYFSGFAEETGEGAGKGYNLNLPLPEQLDGPGHLQALHKAIKRIQKFAPEYLIISLGLDTAKGDPTGTWTLGNKDFTAMGAALGQMKLPTVLVQEGGYRSRSLGPSARSFFQGFDTTRN